MQIYAHTASHGLQHTGVDRLFEYTVYGLSYKTEP